MRSSREFAVPRFRVLGAVLLALAIALTGNLSGVVQSGVEGTSTAYAATAPNTTITSGPSGTKYTSLAKFSFTSSISGSTFQCKLDTGSWTSCTSPKTYRVSYKSHTFQVRAVKSGAADSTPAPRSWAAKAPVTITLSCTTNPETTRVVNANPNAWVTIKTVGSLHEPRTNEPFTVSRTLSVGTGVTFKSGYAATAGASTTLTRQYIYDNTASNEGVRVVTSAGTVTKRCP